LGACRTCGRSLLFCISQLYGCDWPIDTRRIALHSHEYKAPPVSSLVSAGRGLAVEPRTAPAIAHARRRSLPARPSARRPVAQRRRCGVLEGARAVQDVHSLVDQATRAAERLVSKLQQDERRAGASRALAVGAQEPALAPPFACPCPCAAACTAAAAAARLQSRARIGKGGARASGRRRQALADRWLRLRWQRFARAFAWSTVARTPWSHRRRSLTSRSDAASACKSATALRIRAHGSQPRPPTPCQWASSGPTWRGKCPDATPLSAAWTNCGISLRLRL
jgi:hypothetical protein